MFGGSGQTPLRIDQTYTTRDQVETQTRYSDLSGTTKVASTTYTYDAGLRLTNLQQRNGSGTLLSNTTYTYDAASRLTAETRNGTATTYTYDATNQLTHDGTTTYSYDLNGNRTMPSYTTGSGNRLSSDGTWTFSYDDEGNLTGKTKGAGLETWSYTYDHDNHLKSVRQTSNGTTDVLRVTYSYDSLGQRVQEDKWKTGVGSATARFVYDGDDVWADLDGTNTLQTRYLRGDNVDEVFARVKSTGAAGWYLTDRLGSVRDVTDASGTVVDHLDYSGFGVVTESNASAGDRYKWTGREYDGETGLQYNRARYYEGGVGGWLSEDPIGFEAGDANLRRYIGNEATGGTDPTGLDRFDLIKGKDHPPILIFKVEYWWRFWRQNKDIPIGFEVDINGRTYIYYDGYTVPKETVLVEAEKRWGDWEDDPATKKEWFKQNSVMDYSSTYGSGFRKEFGTDLFGKLEEMRQWGLQTAKDSYVNGPLTTAGGSVVGGGIQIIRNRRGIPQKFGSVAPVRAVDYSGELTRNTSNATRTLRNNLNTNSATHRPHHIIPLQTSEHPVVQAAARGGFNINGANNGINLELRVHPQGARHPRYNAAVQQQLDNLAARNLTDAQAAAEVQAIADRLRPGLDRLNQSGQPLR